MKVSLSTKPIEKAAVEVVAIGVQENWTRQLRGLDRLCRGKLLAEAKRQRFGGQPSQSAVIQTHGMLPAPYVVLTGVGASPRAQGWFELAQAAVSRGLAADVRRVAVTAAPEELLTATAIELLAQGLLMARYTFQEHKAASRNEPRLRDAAVLLPGATKEARAAVERGAHLGTATCYARDLANRPADVVTPAYLAQEAERLAKQNDLRLRVLDEDGLRAAKMGALLGVGRGSAQPPRFIELIYRPGGRPSRRVALAGKGITFDTGGLSLKNAASMEQQKRDMAGAAAVLGAMSVVRPLHVRAEVRAYIPAAENMPSDRSIKPGDVLTAANGKTIEVLNTDAEGRLVLADALSCAAAAHPDVIIDLATLTAAVRMALGPRYAAIMGTQPELVQALIAAGAECDERLWELPLVEEYRQDITSAVADVKNTGAGSAGTIIGGLFLREFIGQIPWAHIDFSSTVIADKPRACHPAGATGFGVRTLLQYLRSL